jgi:hypothetical protein
MNFKSRFDTTCLGTLCNLTIFPVSVRISLFPESFNFLVVFSCLIYLLLGTFLLITNLFFLVLVQYFLQTTHIIFFFSPSTSFRNFLNWPIFSHPSLTLFTLCLDRCFKFPLRHFGLSFLVLTVLLVATLAREVV